MQGWENAGAVGGSDVKNLFDVLLMVSRLVVLWFAGVVCALVCSVWCVVCGVEFVPVHGCVREHTPPTGGLLVQVALRSPAHHVVHAPAPILSCPSSGTGMAG